LKNRLQARRAGLLLHPTSLPGSRNHGDLGAGARRFVDFLAASGFSVWQTLPLGPTHEDGSPYQCLSVHAGNPELISLDELVASGWLDEAVADTRACLARARAGFESRANQADRDALRDFRQRHAFWIDDYALYQAIRRVHQGAPWYNWPEPLRSRDSTAIGKFRATYEVVIEQACFEQFLFFTQWQALRDYARERGIALFGDIPIFVAHDSADVWARRELFSIDASGKLDVVSGVPPDYFSATGQRWGNPLYRWERVADEDYRWWLERFRSQLELFDIIRLDHFRGFEKYWEIAAQAETAIEGRWVEGPGTALFERLAEEFGDLPLVAEDLGLITPEVEALRTQLSLPGMKILQFAFDGSPGNPYLPHNHDPLAVVYTGTHDNDTSLGWYRGLTEAGRQVVDEYLGLPSEPMPWPLIRAALASVAELAILPMQDILALGSEHRMNTPGTTADNWRWRFDWDQASEDLVARMHHLIRIYGRAGSRAGQ
jgi:4-alpha-glucanotransferase